MDARVPDPEAFAVGGREVIVLNLDEDGLAQIASALSGRNDVAALHIVSHGGDGYFTLGSGQVDAASMQTTQLAWLQSIAGALSADGDILIYACDFAASQSGLDAMNLLADITAADVAASTDSTGNASLGGDWVLEQQVGQVDAEALDLPAWEGELRLLTGTELVDDLLFSGSAELVEGEVATFRLTPDQFTMAGTAQSTFEINLASDFDFEFQIYLGDNAAGADGITFVMHNDPAGAGALGVPGGGMGALGIQNGVAIEFDTYNNNDGADIEADHTAIWDTDSAADMVGLTYLTSVAPLSELEDGGWHAVAVHWDAATETLSYSVGGVAMGSASNLVSDGRFGGGSVVHFGWTGATGGATNLQQVRLDTFQGDLNFAPTAVNDDFVADENQVIALGSLTANDSDADGDAIFLAPVSGAGSNGGFFSFDDSGNLYFLPNGNFDNLSEGQTTTTSFDYTLVDALGASASATVTVTVHGANDTPIAVNDSFNVNEDEASYIGDLLANDQDVDGDAMFLSLGGPAVSGDNGGLFSRDDSGSLVFIPNGDFDDLAVGETRTTSFNYTVVDAHGASANATATITVHGRNDNPHGVADQYFASEDSLATLGDVLANDIDVEGDPLSMTATAGAGSAGGLFSLDEMGALVFNPNGDFADLAVGESRDTSFNYTVMDDQGGSSLATVTVTVYGTNDNPTAQDDAFIAQEHGVETLGNVLENDGDPEGDALSMVAITTAGDNGGVFSVGEDGALSFDPDGAFDDLAPGESRITSFIYDANDASGGRSSATVSVTVYGSNDNPVAADDTFTVLAAGGATALGNLLANDTDAENDTLSMDAIDGAAGSNGGRFSVSAEGDLVFDANGEFDDLTEGQSRDTTFSYFVNDGQGGNAVGTVTVTVSGGGVVPVDPVEPVAPMMFAFGDAPGGDAGAGQGDDVPLVTDAPAADFSHEVVFVDARVPDPEAFAVGGREVIVLNLDEDGLAQIASALSGRNDVAALHIVSHGGDGYFTLGSGQVDAASMQTTQLAWLQSIAGALSADGDILIYACDFAASQTGLDAMDVLAQITVADVAASVQTTGQESLGADWTLEAAVGTVEAAPIAPDTWVHTLAQGAVSDTLAPAAAPELALVGTAPPAVGASDVPVTVAPVATTLAMPTPIRTVAPLLAAVDSNAAAPTLQAIRMPELESAVRLVWQSLDTAAPVREAAPVATGMFVGVETTTEWTQNHAGERNTYLSATAWAPALPDHLDLDELPLDDAAANGDADADGGPLAVRAERTHAAVGFKAQLARWAQWPAQRPLTRAAARG